MDCAERMALAREQKGARAGLVLRLDLQAVCVGIENVHEFGFLAERRNEPGKLVHERIDDPYLAAGHLDDKPDATGAATRAAVGKAAVRELR